MITRTMVLELAAAVLTLAFAEGAAARGGSYAHVMPPSETSIGGFSINAFKGAQAAYYKCAAVPAAER